MKGLKYTLLLLFLLVLFLSIPRIQTSLASVVTERLNKKFDTHIVVSKVDLSLLGRVHLKGIEIRDHHNDTLIFVKHLKTSVLSAQKMWNSEFNFGAVSLENAFFHTKTYAGESSSNLTVFAENFKTSSVEKKTPFVLNSSKIYVEGLHYKVVDENKNQPLQFAMYNSGGVLRDFEIVGPHVTTNIRGFHFKTNNALEVAQFDSDFSYTKTTMLLKNTLLATSKSTLETDLSFTYTMGDFSNFNDRVQWTATFKESQLALSDLNLLYREIQGNEVLHFTGAARGTLNDFNVSDFNLHAENGLAIQGDFNFINSVATERGFVFQGDLKRVLANYQQLNNSLPRMITKNLPSELTRLGTFSLAGSVAISPEEIKTKLTLVSEIGTSISDLKITEIDNINTATYSGAVFLQNFDLGVFLQNPLLGEVNLQGNVLGAGFGLQHMNTAIEGTVSSLDFKGYSYRDITLNGQFQNKKFNGEFTVADPNLQLDFKGLADFSSKIHAFDCNLAIARVDLLKTNLFVRDSIAILKGNAVFDIQGNTFDDVLGNALFTDVAYISPKKQYAFDKFEVQSSLKKEVKYIQIFSKDIVDGTLEGDFRFKELFPVVQNALGSVYTHYTPIVVAPHQFVDFDFAIHNQIIDVFFPEVYVGENTRLRGKIKSDNDVVKLTFSSPKIKIGDNSVETVLLRMDTKNPWYNTHVTAGKIHTEKYKLSELNLLNKTVNDTLYFKSVFKGGVNETEKFDIDFYYTINALKKSVIGVQRSSVHFKDQTWVVNPENNKESKVTFELQTQELVSTPITVVSGVQRMEFKGAMKDSTLTRIEANLTQVALENLVPKIDSLSMSGAVNGLLFFEKEAGKTQSKGRLQITNFVANDFVQGDVNLAITGGDSYQKLAVSLSIEKAQEKSLFADGMVDFSTLSPTVDLRVKLADFKLNAISPLGGQVLTDLRGTVSGDFAVTGLLRNPSFKGAIALKNAGLAFPYLQVDYVLKGNTVIRLDAQSFLFNNMLLEDVKYKTTGVFNGSITHQNFKQWFLNFDLNTDKLLLLNTQENEKIQYYGTAFLKGIAKIRGLTNNLTIDVDGSTQPGTVFVIPLNDIKTVNNYKLIHFKTANVAKTPVGKLGKEAIEGLNLNINLSVTKDAVAQVVIDKASGSELKGSGEGDFQIEINTRGKFNMFGDFVVDNGVYNFKYGGVINKPFQAQKGGTISWDGDPLAAELDIVAVYQAKANPAVLLENYSQNRKIPVDLYTKISGGLFSSKQAFDIKIPNANSTIASELELKLNDNDTNSKMRQFFSLLITGRFFEEDNFAVNATTGLTGTATDLVSNVLSDILNTKDGKVQLGVGYTQGEKSDVLNLNTDNQVDISVSTQLSDRVLVNGKVGVPVGTNTQTNVVGDVKLEVLLNKAGNFRGIVFNRQNEVQYSASSVGEEEGYTQGVGLSYQVNFNSFSELLRKIGLKKKKAPKKAVSKDTVIATPHKKLQNFTPGNSL